MEFNIEIRRKQLENLDQFISSSKDRVDSILDYLGWNAQKIAENQKEMVKCMINPSHRIPASSASSHMQSCAWRKEMYDDDDLPLSEPNPIPGSTILIDDIAKVNILNNALVANPHMKTGWRSTEPVPKTSNRLVSTFTSDERLALYDYTISSSKGPPQVPEFNIEPKIEEKHNLTPRELEALERDAKRRRIKYKSKSVHTNRKSATEVLREVIDGQMEQYEEWLKEQNGTTTTNKNDIKQEKIYSPPEPSSPRSSKSPNSYKSEESRHRNTRNHSRERTRDRSRSSSRNRNRYSRFDRKKEYLRRKYEEDKRKFEERDYDKRKYEEKEYEKKKYEEKEEKRKNEEKEDKKRFEEEKKRLEEKKKFEEKKYESRDPRRRRRSSSTHSRTKSDN